MIEIINALFGHANQIVAGPLQFSVAAREVLAIVGPSGCGKTTILKTIAGEIPVRGGAIVLDGFPQDRDWLIANLARTIQSFPLLHWLTVEANLTLAASIKKVTELDVDRVLAEFSATHLKHRYPRTLSGGERCRASLAQAAISKPKILLLDEPFSGLDLKVKEEIADRLFSFADSHASAIIFVTHDLFDAIEYARRVVVLNHASPARVAGIVATSETDAVSKVRAALTIEEC